MPRTLRFCIISIFLCAAFSVSAQSRQDALSQALACERAAYEHPETADSLLLVKAGWLIAAGERERAAETLRRIRPFFLSEPCQNTFTRLQEGLLPAGEDTKKSAGKADSIAGDLCGSLTSAGYIAWQVAGGYYLGALPGLFVLEHFFTRLLHQTLESHKGHRQDTDGN